MPFVCISMFDLLPVYCGLQKCNDCSFAVERCISFLLRLIGMGDDNDNQKLKSVNL